MNENERRVLSLLGEGAASAQQLALELKMELGGVVSTLEKLAQEGLAQVEKKEELAVELTPEGAEYAKHGTPEKRLLQAVEKAGKEGLAISGAAKAAGLQPGQVQIALQWAMRKKWLKVEKNAEGKDGLKAVVSAGEAKEPQAQELKAALEGKKIQPKALEELKGRKLVEEKVRKKVFASATSAGRHALSQSTQMEVSQLTPQMLKTGEWKGKKFREYDLSTVAAPVQVARKHVYKEFLYKIKETLVGLGFREVRGSLVEMEFWNMDALYMPQDHPARQIHDVFRVKEPAAGEIPDDKLFEEMFAAHKHGGKTGSRGWQYEMSREISSRLILRSHDTGISARELFRKLKPPERVFFIAHVFRPDEIDWKHFIEFNQLGGYVADENTSFRDLLGLLKSFGEEVFSAEKVRFIPSYYPFTEPSVSMFVKIPERGWAEVGGAGLFRPEMLSALGIDYPVIAWGLGIDRLAMLTIGINDIRELHSHSLPFLQSK